MTYSLTATIAQIPPADGADIAYLITYTAKNKNGRALQPSDMRILGLFSSEEMHINSDKQAISKLVFGTIYPPNRGTKKVIFTP